MKLLGSSFAALLLPLLFAGAALAEESREFTAVRDLLQTHCFDCHGANERQSGLRFDDQTGYRASDRRLWTLAHEQLRTRRMPPPDGPKLSDEQRERMLRWIERSQRAEPGLLTRRLNRRELNASLQDLTGLRINFSYALPGDGTVDGFDTGVDGLQDSADSVRQCLEVTRGAVEPLRFLEPSNDKTYAADVREAKDVGKVFEAWKAEGVSAGSGDVVARPGTGWLIKPKWLGDRGGFSLRLPPPARRNAVLRLELEVSAKKFVSGVPNPHLWIEIGGRDVDYVELSDSPRVLTYEMPWSDVHVDAKGLSIHLVNRVETPYAVEGFANEEKGKPEERIPGGTGLFRPEFDAKSLPPEQQPIPFVVLHRFEITPDYRPLWPPESWESKKSELADGRGAAEFLLSLWMERAWRRAVGEGEKARFLALYEERRAQGASFDDALRSSFHAVLMSGSFRYLVSPGTDASRAHDAVASRLSYMLWGSPPDATLRELARAKKLRDPEVLREQVDRLLDDPRGAGFAEPFVTQWLEMGQPITLAMDHIQKQDFRFGRNLKSSMRRETIAYVEACLRENRPARELISSDWTMMNDILARHYGYAGIEGSELRKVTLRDDDPRGGGVLGHAGIQSMLCWMGDNWVIYRGAWTLRRLLDAPPPPPPLEVPELLPSEGENRGKTFKELLKRHQADVRCSVCHKAMDPLGFAFQNFDLSGRWRELEYERYVKNDLDGKIEWRGEGKTRPVDATGALPRGEEFQSFAECKSLLVKNYTPDAVSALLKHWHLYGVGRQPDVADLEELRAVMARSERHGYPLRELLHGLVQTRSFLER